MEAARATGTDPRHHDQNDRAIRLEKKVDDSLARLDKKIDERFARLDAKIDKGIGRLDDRIDALHHALAYVIALISIITVLFAALVGIVATHI